jgi:hypothetical protein
VTGEVAGGEEVAFEALEEDKGAEGDGGMEFAAVKGRSR